MMTKGALCILSLAVMQLSSGLPQFDFGSAIGGGSPTCLQACPTTFQPVCGNDGQTYQNDCELQNAACRSQFVRKVSDGQCERSQNQIQSTTQGECPEACPDNSQPVCGNDGNSYKNECQLLFISCRDPTIFKVSEGDCAGTDTGASSTPDTSPPVTSPSTSQAAALVASPAAPECPVFCPVEFRPVCGSDGTSYRNECELSLSACRDPSVVKAFDGQCVN